MFFLLLLGALSDVQVFMSSPKILGEHWCNGWGRGAEEAGVNEHRAASWAMSHRCGPCPGLSDADGSEDPAPSSHLEPLGLWVLSIQGQPRPKEAMLGHPVAVQNHTSTKKCFKTARFDDSQGGMLGDAGAAPLHGAAGRVGEHSSSPQFEWL